MITTSVEGTRVN